MNIFDRIPPPEGVSCGICSRPLAAPPESTDASGWVVYIQKPADENGPEQLAHAHGHCYFILMASHQGWYAPAGKPEDSEPPCTCPPNCKCPDGGPCKGGCGCQACHNSYQDFLSEDYD